MRDTNTNNSGVKRGRETLKRDYVLGVLMLVVVAMLLGGLAIYCIGSIKLLIGIASCFGSCEAVITLIKIWSE